ncbi:MAG TPA: outer membrane protein assembly factor BamA [Pseudomonadales bacterium]
MIRKSLSRSLSLSACAIALLGLPAARAQQLPPAPQVLTVADIRIEGLQRVAASSVFGLLNVRVGDQVDQQDITNLIRDVFASDYFDNIEVLTEDNVLIIRVTERPTISEINIEGNKLIPTEALRENMTTAGLAVGQIYKPSTLEGMQLALEEQYIAQGMYGARVELDVDEQERNRVALNINIDEGDASKIVHINIVGNTVFEEEELLDLFELRTTGWLSWLRKDDRYAREKINGDLERLTSYYMDQGYINFDITSTQVSVSPDKSQVYITVNISEGEVYTVDQVELAGDLVDSEDLLRLVLQVRDGQVFSQQLVTTTSEFMTTLLGNRGYFFAEVEGVPLIDEETKTVDITFFVEPGARTYVNRISFFGNTNTADEVLRRELRQMEGAPASNAALEQSKVRMERLGYFETVEFETTPVPGTNDQIDVDFTVAEQLSGQITGSIGYGQVQGFILQAAISQANFLGTGKTISLGAETSAFSTNYNFNYFDPYYTIDGVSRGFGISYSSSDYAELNLAAFSTDQFSVNTTYGYRLSETQGLSFNLGFSNTKIDEGYGAVQEIKASPSLDQFPGVTNYIVRPGRTQSFYDPNTGTIFPITDPVIAPISQLPPTAFNQREGFLDREGNKFNNLTLGVTWTESTLNLGLFPTAGSAQSLSFEFTVPGSDLSYYRLRYYNEKFFPLTAGGNWIIHARADLGYGDGYGSTEQLPFFQNFYAGGQGTVRGFERNTLGPRSTFYQEYLPIPSGYLKDNDGNIVLDITGAPTPDPSAPLAYLLQQAVDAEGNPLIDTDGLPIYRQELARTASGAGFRSAPFGGNIQTVGTLELLFPLPFIEDRSRVRSSLFVDVGNVFSSYCTDEQLASNNCSNFEFDELRYSAGISVAWQSGLMGVMSFSLAKAFNSSNIDETEVFQFNLGQSF